MSVWRLHRKIGMSGGLFTKALARETGLDLSPEGWNGSGFFTSSTTARVRPRTRALPGARELLAYLSDNGIPWAIATSGRIETAGPVLKILGVDPARHIVITRDMVRYAKPDPDLFLAAAEKLEVDIGTACVVGMRSGTCWPHAGRAPWHRPPLWRLRHGGTRTRGGLSGL